MLLTVDGRRLRTGALAVTVCNGPYYGFGFALAPEADPADGQLDVVVFSGMSRADVVGHYLAVARGRPRREPRVRHITARRVDIAGLRRLVPVHADGESLGMTPIAFAVRPAGLRIFGQPPQLPGSPVAAAASAPKTRA
jgi:diacylglycerol kinase family enzyme